MVSKLASAAALVVGLVSTAQAQPAGAKWSAGLSDVGDPYTATINDSGSFFGKWCDGSLCFWMLATADRCEDETVLFLATADSGTMHLKGNCAGARDAGGVTRYRVVIDSAGAEALERAVLNPSNKVIGFAMALQSGEFRVVRFQLDGAIASLSKFDTYRRAKPVRPSTRDSRL